MTHVEGTVSEVGFARNFVETPASEWAAHVAALELVKLVEEGREREVFPVTHECCRECLFSPNKVVTGRRAREVLRDVRAKDSHFVCHKATMRGGYNVACRGWYDRFHSTVSRLAEALGLVRFVRVKSLPDSGGTLP